MKFFEIKIPVFLSCPSCLSWIKIPPTQIRQYKHNTFYLIRPNKSKNLHFFVRFSSFIIQNSSLSYTQQYSKLYP
jgi:hypothetical protein